MATYCSSLAWRIPGDRGVWGGYSPWGHKDSVMAERLSIAHTPTGLCGGIHLSKKLRTHLGEAPMANQVCKE